MTRNATYRAAVAAKKEFSDFKNQKISTTSEDQGRKIELCSNFLEHFYT